MNDKPAGGAFPALAFAVRSRLYAFEQRGSATLLPWLQRYTGTSSAPGLPAWCLGILNVRGTVQMAVDLGILLGYGPSEASDGSRLIFIEHGDAQLGLLVDMEIGVRYLRPHDVPNDALGGPFAIATGLLDSRPVTILDGALIIRHVAEELGAPVYLT